MSWRWITSAVTSVVLVATSLPVGAVQPDSADNVRLEVPSPVGRKGSDSKNWAKLDLPYTFRAGVIWVKIQPGRRIDELMQKDNLPGPARQLWDPPYTPIAQQLGLDRWFEVGVNRGIEKQIVRRLSPEYSAGRLTDFVYVHLSWDFPGWTTLTPNDPQYPNQSSYLEAIGMPRAWDKQVASSAVTVAIVDSGLRGSHEDSGVWKQKTGWDYVNSQDIFAGADTEWYNGSACFNGDGHGTQVGTIAVGDTNNGKGVASSGFNAAIMPIRTLGTTDGANCVWVVPQDRRGWGRANCDRSRGQGDQHVVHVRCKQPALRR